MVMDDGGRWLSRITIIQNVKENMNKTSMILNEPPCGNAQISSSDPMSLKDLLVVILKCYQRTLSEPRN